jgi:hypothetical protein
MDDTGNVLMRLVGVDVPTKVNTDQVDVCCMCGSLTVSGIYEFKDPSKVYFADGEGEAPEFELEMNEYGTEWED